MAFGSGSGTVTSGDDILAEWNFESANPWNAFSSLMGPYSEMLNIGIENMRAQQPRDAEAFSLWKQGKGSELENEAMMRELEKKRWEDYRRTKFMSERDERDARARADFDRRAALNDALTKRGPGGYGGESAHQSEAQLQGWGVAGPDGSTYAPAAAKAVQYPAPPPSLLGGPAGSGMGGQTNINNVAAPAPGAAFGAMAGRGGGMSYVPFQTAWGDTRFESADIDTERKKKDE